MNVRKKGSFQLSLTVAALVAGAVFSLAAIRASGPTFRKAGVVQKQTDQVSRTISFEKNLGQSDSSVKFLNRGNGHAVFLTDREAVFALGGSVKSERSPKKRLSRKGENQPDTVEGVAVRMAFLDSEAAPEISATEPLTGTHNYFKGNDTTQWTTDVPLFARVNYKGVYPKIDLTIYTNESRLEYDFLVAPGANPNLIRLGFTGADRVEVDPDGNLLLHTRFGVIRQEKPLLYQMVRNVRKPVEGRYLLRGPNEVGFEVGGYDPNVQLVIDPFLVYSTFLGGAGDDAGNSVAVDSTGNAYVTGRTVSFDFPVAGQTVLSGSVDTFISKVNSTGDGLVYSSYIGGNGFDEGNAVAVDANGSAYIAGETNSANFPLQTAFQNSRGGGRDAFLLKLNPSGNALSFSTYLGGANDDAANGVAVDTNGSAFVAGVTSSNNFPVSGAFQSTSGGSGDAFVTRFNPNGGTVAYSTYLGGADFDVANGIAIDGTGSAFVAGTTGSSNFPTQSAFQAANNGLNDAFLTKLNPSGSTLAYSTYLGGFDDDGANAVALDSTGTAYVTGYTISSDFPTAGPFGPAQAMPAGGQDAFVTRFQTNGGSLLFSTFLGGNGTDEGTGIVVDFAGTSYVTGRTNASNFPALNSTQANNAGGFDAFVTSVTNNGVAFLNSTYLGGGEDDTGAAITLDSGLNAYVTGGTSSANFPVFGAFQSLNHGNGDGFLTKIRFNACPIVTVSPDALPPGIAGVPYSQTLTASNGTGPYTFSASASLPFGFSLSSDGILSSPRAANFAPATFTVTATDANGCQGMKQYTLAFECQPVTLYPSAVPNGSVGQFYSQTISAAGDGPNYSFGLNGNLPPGLTLLPQTGNSIVLTGVPTTPGSYNFSLSVSANCSPIPVIYTLVIAPASGCATVAILPASLPDTVSNGPYRQSFTASGGVGPYRFISNTLPSGLRLSTDGVLSGSVFVNSTATFNLTITAIDANGCAGSVVRTLQVTTCPAITISPATSPSASVGALYDQTFTASGGVGPYFFFGIPPPGLTLLESGRLVGVPVLPSTDAVQIFAFDANFCQATLALPLTITASACPGITFGASTSTAGTVGVPYSVNFDATGGVAPYSFTVVARGLPAGLTLSTNGVLSGIPTQSGEFYPLITAADANGCRVINEIPISIACVSSVGLSPMTLPDISTGVPYSQTLNGTGGVAPYTFSLAGNPQPTFLPMGLSLSSSGAISGTIQAIGNFSFSVRVVDANGCSFLRDYTLKAVPGACPNGSISPSTLPNATVGSLYTQSLFGSGGLAPYAFTISSGALPDGFGLYPDGTLIGVTDSTGTFSFSVTATDLNGCSSVQAFSLESVAGTCSGQSVFPATLPTGDVTNPNYDQTLSVSGGGSFTFLIVKGRLPSGLTMTRSGRVSGRLTGADTSSFTVIATDSNGCRASRTYSLTTGCPSLTLSPNSPPNAAVNRSYNQTFTVNGGSGRYFFSLDSGALPPGLNLVTDPGNQGPTFAIRGVPTQNGTFSFGILTTDTSGGSCQFSQSLSIIITEGSCPTITIPNGTQSPGSIIGVPFTFALQASGGTAPYTYSLGGSGMLPTGLSLNSNGVISGTPAVGAVDSFFNVIAMDAAGCAGQEFLFIPVSPNPDCPVLALSPGTGTTLSGTVSTIFNQRFQAAGGRAPYRFSTTSLLFGLRLSESGILSGVPTFGGSTTFSMTVTDADGCQTTIPGIALAISPSQCGQLTFENLPLPDGRIGQQYNTRLRLSFGSGRPPLSYRILDGFLPPGMVLTENGILTGVPNAAGVFDFSVSAVEYGGCSAARTAQIVVREANCPTISLPPNSFPSVSNGSAFSLSFSAMGGVAPYSFSITGGTLPPGLTLNPTGLLVGTPTSGGSYSFTVTAIDANGCHGSRVYTLLIGCSVLSVSPASLPDGTTGLSYNQSITASGGQSPYQFSFTGQIPAGLTLSATGQLTGTPTATGTFSFSVLATDTNGCVGNSNGYTVSIAQGSGCSYVVSPGTIPIPAPGGTTSVTVTTQTGCAWTAATNSPFITITSGASGSGNGTVQISVTYNNGIPRSGTLTIAGQTVTVTQPARNASTPGQFRPSNGFAYIRNTNDTGFADSEFFYGTAGDVPVSGDWNGDGIDTIGIYRNGTFFLRNSNSSGFADIQFPFGAPGDIPIVGDWNGDGIDTVGIVRGNTIFLRNSNTAGNADIQFAYGTSTDIFITGDWNGDGIDTIGCFRPTNGFVYIRNTNTTGIADFEFFYGQAGDKPVVGDWNGDGVDTIGIVRGNQWFLRNSNTSGFAEIQFFYGTDTDIPITGDWNGQP